MFALRLSRRGRGAALAATLTVALGAAMAAAPAAGAAPPGRASAAAAAAPRRAAGGPARSAEAAAVAQARSSGKTVVVPSLTTETSQTTANPDGTLTLTQSVKPARAQKAGKWVPLDATLTQSGSELIPAATATPLALSAGGSGPFARLSAAGRTLALSWPGTLPVPVISGATATYPDVLPGVDLAVTADTQGGVSDTLVIHSAAAAANPALRSLAIDANPSPGLGITADAAGDLAVGAGGKAQPLFTAQPPMMWDSAPPPAGMATVTGAGGVAYGAGSGLPAYSSLAAPGAGAHVARVPLTASGTTITLAPPASALAGAGITYPVYIDPTWHSNVTSKASNWTQVDSGYPTSSNWNESSDLQLGLCDFAGCNGIGAIRSFFTMPISSVLTGASINTSYIYMQDQWAPSCTKESVGLYTTSAISSSTTWNNQPAWSGSAVQTQTFAFQDPAAAPGTACPMGNSPNVTWTVTSTVKADAGHVSSQAFGLKAGSETNDLYWKQFYSGTANIWMTTNYDYTPNAPTGPTANGACGTSGTPSQIGYDDVTLTAAASDNDGDVSGLSTTFTVYNSDGTVADTIPALAGSTPTGVIARTVISGWHAGIYTYHFSGQTTDSASLTSGASVVCYFTYNPAAPAGPTVAISPAPPYTLGQSVTATITEPSGCGTGSNPPCPTSYNYQVGTGQPQSVSIGTGSCTAAACPVSITLSQIGPVTFGVTGLASGNPSSTTGVSVNVSPLTTAYPDGYFTNGTYPDLLTIPSGAAPGMWLSRGSGNGVLAAAADIGGAGTGINPGTDGPADWAGATLLHGDFTGDNVQDVLAYYPAKTSGVVIPGDGTGLPLISTPNNDKQIPAGSFTDPFFNTTATGPVTLVAAGDASQAAGYLGYADLIGAYGDATNGYELALFSTPQGQVNYGGGNVPIQLAAAATSPDGTTWDKFQLATAQVGGSPNNTTLFALDTTNGKVYESVNPGCPSACSATSLIGTAGTWTQLAISSGTITTLLSADINQGNVTEVWGLDATGTKATGYTLSGTTLTPEGTGNTLTRPNNDWPLADGTCGGSTPATATDTTGGDNGAINGGFTWTCDNTLGTVLTVNGATGYVMPPVTTIPNPENTGVLSLWFKTSTADGVIAGLQNQPPGAAINGGYDPVLYVGTDGKLYAEWWTQTLGPIHSINPVDDGLWHHVIISAAGNPTSNTQTLTIDGVLQNTLSGKVAIASTYYLTFGAGYNGGGWPMEKYKGKNGNYGWVDYFAGQIANITFTH